MPYIGAADILEKANATSKGLWENSQTITQDYTINASNNAVSAGPISIASGVSVTVPTGTTWTIV